MSDRYLSVDAGRVRFEIDRLMEAFPALAEDDQLRADMIEGEVGIETVMTRIYRSLREDEAMAEGAKALKDDLAARQKRYEARVASKKALAMAILDAADLPKLTLPVATFSVQDGKVRTVVDNVDELAQGFYQTVRQAKTDEIRAALMKGAEVPGARLEIGDAFLRIGRA